MSTVSLRPVWRAIDFVRRDIFRADDALRRELECPRQNERDRKPQHTSTITSVHRPVRQIRDAAGRCR